MFQATYVIQLDVLIKNGIAQRGAIAFMKKLEEENMPYVIITEQSGRIRDHIADYLVERGFRYIRPSAIYTSSMACVDYIHLRYPKIQTAAYLGGAGIKEAIQKGGYRITFDHPEYVIVGMNKKSTYLEYSKIALCIREGALFLSSDNRVVQNVDGIPLIGNAAIIQMLECASGKHSITFGRGSENLLLMTKLFYKKKIFYLLAMIFKEIFFPQCIVMVQRYLLQKENL